MVLVLVVLFEKERSFIPHALTVKQASVWTVVIGEGAGAEGSRGVAEGSRGGAMEGLWFRG